MTVNVKTKSGSGPRNTSGRLIAEERRRAVAAMRRRRLTVREIILALAQAGHVNPRTGKPWSLGVISNDIQHLQAEARAEAIKDVSEHKAEILADYEELLRIAWREKDHAEVRRILKDVRELLGTDAPQVIVFEQVQERMLEAVDAIEREFADDPALAERALRALMGGSDTRPVILN